VFLPGLRWFFLEVPILPCHADIFTQIMPLTTVAAMRRSAPPSADWAVDHLVREDGNAPRSDAGWVRREINCTAGWSCAGRSWRWHGPWVAIRSSTDERRAQTRGASKRVRGLQELRAGGERERLFS